MLDKKQAAQGKTDFSNGVPPGIGPNNKNQMNILDTMKANDKNYDNMLDVATDIHRT